MAIKFHPKVGTVLFCDFTGFVAPEMVKGRKVIVISSPNRNNQLVTVVPISTSEPGHPKKWHIPLNKTSYRDHREYGATEWVKCDMIYTLRKERFSLVKRGKCAQSGKRLYDIRPIIKDDLDKVFCGIQSHLNLT